MAHDDQHTPDDSPLPPRDGSSNDRAVPSLKPAQSAAAVAADVSADAEAALPDLLPEDGPDRHPVVKALLIVGAVLSCLLGVVGWLLPVITGVPFYILAAVLAGMANRRAAVFINRQERRLPRRLRLLLRPKQRRALRDKERAARGE